MARVWWGIALVAGSLLGACGEEESAPRCPVRTLGTPDSVEVMAAGAACLVPGPDSAWAFTWRLEAWPGSGYVIRTFRVDSTAVEPWEGGLTIQQRPRGGGVPTTAATPWGTYGPLNDRTEAMFRTDSAMDLLVQVLVPRAVDGGLIAVVVDRCVPVPIVPPDTLPVVELAAGCQSRSFEPGRLSRVTMIPLNARGASVELVHVETVRTSGGYLHPVAVGPGADLGCSPPACFRRDYPVFNGTLGHYIDPTTAGRYTYLLGVDADSAGLASVRMVLQAVTP